MFVCLFRAECSSNEAKAQEKRKAVQEGFKEAEEGLKTLAAETKAKNKEHKKLCRYPHDDHQMH